MALNAQTYTKHYIAPAPWQYWSKANEVVVATNSTSAVTVTIQKSDGTLMATLSAVAGTPAVYRFTALPSTLAINALNTVLNAAGMIVTGTRPISVNVRNVASDALGTEGTDTNIKGNASLFSFGDAAIGSTFRVGYYRDGSLNSGTGERPTYSIMAIGNNTTIKIGGVATTTLNAGQSYLFRANIGTLVESSGPAVMNTGASFDAPVACADGTSNPVPPISSLGAEYVVIRGNGNTTAEQSVIIATEANTTLTITNFNLNGTVASTSTVNLVAGGSFTQIPNGVGTTRYTSTRIVATKNVVVYSGSADGCEVDVATIAPIASCGGSLRAESYKFRGYAVGSGTPPDLPYFGFILTRSLTDKVYLTTKGSATINYTGTDIETIPGIGARRQLGSSGIYEIDFTNVLIGAPSVFTLTSASRLTIAAIESGAGFSMANYISPFPEKALQPTVNQTDCASATLSVDAGSSGPYQWYLDGAAIAGATGSTLVATASGSYSVTSQLDCGISAQSLPATVALCNIDRSIVKTVDNLTPSVGATVTFTLTAKNLGIGNAIGVSATDLLPNGFTFVSATASGGTSYNAATGLWSIGSLGSNAEVSLVIKAIVKSTGSYVNTAAISGTQTDNVTSNDVSSVTLTPAASIGVDVSGTDAQTVCINNAITNIVYSIGGTATGATVTGLPAGVTASYSSATKKLTISGTPTAATAGTQTYTVTTVGGTPNSTTTGTITVQGVVGTPVFAAGTASSRCQGSEVITYAATAANTTGITYTLSNSSAGVINSATGEVTWSSLFSGTATITASAAGCSGPKTAVHTVTVSSTGAVNSSTTVCAGDATVRTLTLSGQSAGSTVSRWESSVDNGVSWQSIANTGTTQTYSNLAVTTMYRAVVVAGSCTNTYANAATITVTPVPVVTDQETSLCGGGGTFTVAPAGVPSGTTYTWAAPVKSPSTITGGTAASNQSSISQALSISGSSAGTVTYTVTPTYSGCTGTSFKVTVTLVPTITATASNPAAICSGSVFSVSPTASVSGIQYTWTAAQLSGAAVSGFSSQTTPVAAPISQRLTNTGSGAGVVRYTVTPILNGCSGTSFNIDVTVQSVLTPGSIGADQTVCANTAAATLNSVSAGTGSGTISYRWESSQDGTTWNTIAQATGASYSPGTLTATTQFRRTALNESGCSSAPSNIVTITVTQPPTPANAGPDQTQYNSGVFTLQGNAPSIGTGTWTVKAGTGTASIANPGSPGTTVTIAPNTSVTLVWSIANGICNASADEVVLTYNAVADLQISKNVNSNSPKVGDIVTFTVTALNNGPSTATAVKVTDVLRAGYAFVAATPSAGTFNPATGEWTIGTLGLNAAQSLELKAEVTANKTAADYQNTAVIAGAENDPVAANNTVTLTTVVPQRVLDMGLVKTAGTAAAGQPLTYTLTVTNNGPSNLNPADVITLTDALPAGFTSAVYTAGSGTYTSANGNWTGLTLAAGQSAALSISGTLAATATGSISNTASLTGPTGTADPVSANNTATVVSAISRIMDFAVVKTAGTAVAGQPLTYTISLTNNGPATLQAADNITVTDALPNGFENPVYTASSGNFSSTTGNWTGLTLASGQSVSLSISGTVAATASGSLSNTAVVNGPADTSDPVNTNNSSTVVSTIGRVMDLGLSKTASAAVAGQPLVYTITVTNNGSSSLLPTDNITITDALPAGFTGAVYAATKGSFTSSNGNWTGLNLGTGQSASLTITGTLSATATGSISNTASVTGPAGSADPNTANNSSTVTTPVSR
ncbi:beta strand repeat-containing protein, partial [Pedobacter africanus]